MRFHREATLDVDRDTTLASVPMGLSAAEGDFKSIRRFADRDHAAIAHWRVNKEVFGHYSARTAPEVITGDIRDFFAEVLKG